ncbi:MAG: hypothetical protein N3D15_04845 [Syntrophorhabdaceae bacterium]|nr:hypothetical protein [Syntrophorhabdaceae bacterium]
MNQNKTLKHMLIYGFKRGFIAIIPLSITFITLHFYGFVKTPGFYPVVFIFFLIYLKAGFKNSILFSITFLIATLLLNLAMGILRMEDRMYYRAHERLTVYNPEIGLKSYKKNMDITVYMVSGDIGAVGSTKNQIEIEPRKIRFKTDSLGFRNNRDYNGDRYVVIGDSFIAANGTSQEYTITSQLKEKWNKDVYSMGYAGGIPEYVKYGLYLQRKTGSDFKVLLFLFEGNDFPESISKRQMVIKKPIFKAYYDAVKAFFEETILYRYTFSLIARWTKKPQESEVLIIKGHRIGEFSDYIHATKRKSYRLPERAYKMLSYLNGKIDHIFFIPTKYRVYFPFIDNRDMDELPNSQWEETQRLAKALNIGCTDLTGPLRKESERLLKEGKFTFWKDDSHWNGYGIAVAAQAVSNHIDTSNR